MSEDKRMYEHHKEHGEDMSYENEQSIVSIPLKEYDKLKDQGKYITDPTLIAAKENILLENFNVNE